MKVFRISLFALLLITLVGCGAQSLNNLNLKKAFGLDKDLDAAPFTVVTPERLSLREKDLPDDAKLVIATLIHQLYMEPGLPSEVSFDKRGRHQLYDPNFDYAGFQFSGIDLIDYSFNKQVSPIEFRIEGLFHFSDLIGRRTSVEYVASYVPVKKGVKILESSIRPIQPVFPEVQCYFVPEAKLKRIHPGSLETYLDWYLFASQNAINLKPTAADIKNKQHWESLSLFDRLKQAPKVDKNRYVIMLFAMDRILDEGSLKVRLSDLKRSRKNEPAHERVTMIDENGWKIALVGAEFAIDSWGSTFYVNVDYSPGHEKFSFDQLKSSTYPVQVGSFSNTKRYPKAETIELTSGQHLLDLNSLEDAKKIQSRLSTLGFYTTTIDGLFGKGSRAALKKFRQSRELGHHIEWDIKVQNALFGQPE